MILRISSLMGVVKGKQDDNSWNNINAVLLLLFMILGLAGFFYYSFKKWGTYEPPLASVHGEVTDRLFWITMVVTLIAFVIIFVAMFWFTFAYRYDKNRKAEFFPDNHYLEITWTVIPAILLVLLIVKGMKVWNDITGPASKDAVVIEMVGQQFAWTARYPGVKDKELGKHNYKLIDASNEFGLDLTDKNSFDDFKSLTLYLPKGKEVLLKIRAKDVIHSVFLPHFRVKMDAVPGMETQFKFTPTKTTEDMRTETGNANFNYEMACTEVCGRGHFSMRFPVVVVEPEEYDKWMASQTPWLKQNPEYMKYVPDNLKEAAAIKAGLPMYGVQAVNSVTLK
ncbi:MAG: cytochrome c oxidase subunit II [Bacteroidetes bacterium]|nr:cytochrome c oxidase subunit II [Bacteroidota bacterium]MBS1981958.1 cytochrome c oxidase subunit II [Bacteroidota bacterium]